MLRRDIMGKKILTINQKKANIDLWIIIISAFIVLGSYITFNTSISELVNDIEIPILLRTLIGTMFQYGIAGLGITLVFIYRKESILSYGLRKKNILITIVLSAFMYLPSIIFSIATGDAKSYLPFQQVMFTKEVLTYSLPIKIIGMAMIATAWGFFEGFNYAVITDKINILYPSKNKWLDIGAITCAVMCILIHGAIGLTPKGIIEMLTVLFLIYGMLMVRKFTGNAWGCVFIFVFLWNAI
jgi:hypothetical protein